MGNFGLTTLRPLAIILRNKYQITHFIETGTHKGHTTRWAANEFQWVTTIEINPELHRNNLTCNLNNIYFVLGDSRTKLAEILEGVPQPALVWLDAHNPIKYDKSWSSKDRCPLRQELAALKPYRHFIFIDDARYFKGKGQFPSKDEIRGLLPEGYEMIVKEDVIICVPLEVMPTVTTFFTSLNFD